MSSWLPYLISSAGDLAAGAVNVWGAKSQNQMTEAAAQKQMEFQERMSSSAYQRAVQDLKKAGLNPSLAYQQGGASSPVGSQAPKVSPVSQATSAYLEARKNRAEISAIEAQAQLSRASAKNVEALSKVSEAESSVKGQEWFQWIKEALPWLMLYLRRGR